MTLKKIGSMMTTDREFKLFGWDEMVDYPTFGHDDWYKNEAKALDAAKTKQIDYDRDRLIAETWD